MEVPFPLFAGIIASILHVISGPDHLAAVIPFAIERKKKAWKVGLLWGIGHLAGMLLIGVLFYYFKEVLPVDAISAQSEKLVGIVLMFLGIWIFIKLFRQENKHKHLHTHTIDHPVIHKHEHSHENEHFHAHRHPDLKQSNFASFSVGFLHGLAGIAHFLMLLPVLGFETRLESAKYIFGFALGTVIAMVIFAFVIGSIAAFSKRDHNDLFFKGIRMVAGLFAFIVGLYWFLMSGH